MTISKIEIKEKDLKHQAKVLQEKKDNLLEDVDSIKEQLIVDETSRSDSNHQAGTVRKSLAKPFRH